jgi:hypothetical protein
VHGARAYGTNSEEAHALRTPRCLGAQESWEGAQMLRRRGAQARGVLAETISN